MHLVVILLLSSLVALGAGLAVPGLSELVGPAFVGALMGAILLVVCLLRRRRPAEAEVGPWSRPRAKRGYILIDGSNVMYWKDKTPRIETLVEVVGHVAALGYTPGVIFDANVGYLIAGRYQDAAALGTALGLPRDRVFVVDKGNPADLTLLAAARALSASIITNDRYREWSERHPEVLKPGVLIRGGYRDGRPWLDLDAAVLGTGTRMSQAAASSR